MAARAALVTVMLLTGAYRAARAQSSGDEAALEKLLAPAVTQLESLARWCDENRMKRERASVLECIVGLRPDHADARRELRYVKGADGRWYRDEEYRPPTRTESSLIPEYNERRGVIVVPLADSVLEFLAGPGFDLAEPARRRVLEALWRLEPRAVKLRSALGERRKGARWVLAETLTARKRSKELRRAAKLLFRGAPRPETDTRNAAERAMRISWTACRTLPGVRVLGTVSLREIDEAVQLATTTMRFFQHALRVTGKPWPGFTIYLFDGSADRDRFLHEHPSMTDEGRAFAEKLSTAWVPGTGSVGIWHDDRQRRFEWVARQTIAMLLENVLGITSARGALYEGLGLLLGHYLTGEHATWFVGESKYQKPNAVSKEQLAKHGSWLRLARSRLRSDPPRYPTLLTYGVNDMDPSLILHSYVLAAYLVEGAPEKGRDFLFGIGAGKPFERVVMGVWGMRTVELQERIVRWLRERGR